ncbi:MAG TPA: hypothetical protein ENK91_10415 [Bacteroidetes bacterium]|nr:hypothetical protein [Bacteroidota bacterium]
MGEIYLYYQTSNNSLIFYRDNIIKEKINDRNYTALTKNELIEAFVSHIDELEKTVSMSILSNVEAGFRIDYVIRKKKRLKDPVSRKFRELFKVKAEKVSLEKEILTIWKEEHTEFKGIISDFIGALKYRHWLAHGRYWTPKLGRIYDFATIYTIAEKIYANLPLKMGITRRCIGPLFRCAP